MDNGFILKKESLVTVCYSVQESKAVKRSIRNLRNDIEKVIGCQCEEMLKWSMVFHCVYSAYS